MAASKATNLEKSLRSEIAEKIKQLEENETKGKKLDEGRKKERDTLMASIKSKNEEIKKLQAENTKSRGLMTKMKEIYNLKQATIEKLNKEIASLKDAPQPNTK